MEELDWSGWLGGKLFQLRRVSVRNSHEEGAFSLVPSSTLHLRIIIGGIPFPKVVGE